MKKSLELTEWILSSCIVLVLFSFLIIARVQEQKKNILLEKLLKEKKAVFEVAITGEILRPGVFSCQAGTRLGDIVKKSRPQKFANFQGIDLDGPVKSSMKIAIPKLTELSVWVVGAVTSPHELQMPLGSRISDLKSKISCTKEADPKFFKRRRLLKNNETLEIPVREQAQPLNCP